MDDQDANEDVIKSSKIVIATPGIKPSHRLYMTYGNKIVSELSFIWSLVKEWYFPRRKNLTLIGITGTNGKSTTTRVLYQAIMKLEKNNINWQQNHIHLWGNFDVPLSWLLLDIIQNNTTQDKHTIILECSSFMLWKLQNFTFQFGVLLNIAPDHIDRHGTMKDYLHSKLNILVYAQTAITNPEIKSDVIKDQMRWISLLHRLRPFWSWKNPPYRWSIYSMLNDFYHPAFPGPHNAQNFGAVDIVLQKLYGIDYDRSILQDIEPVAHRLQTISINSNLTIIDDSVSSSAHALWAALDAMSEPVILIAWWYDNGENYQELLSKIQSHVQIAVFYGQTRAILYPLAKQVIADAFMVDTLSDAMKKAIELSKKKSLTTILYSPWAKSFDQFDNVYHRIKIFEEEIRKIR